MYLGLPIIASDVIYNKATTEEKALYFRDSTSLINLVTFVLESREVLLSLGNSMKEIADRRYTWKTIVNKYESLY